MTTPQSILFNIHYKLNNLIRYFEDINDDEINFFDKIDSIHEFVVNTNVSRLIDKLDHIRDRLDGLDVDSMSDRLQKFEDNYKRFEIMFNEFKGVIAMTRSNLKSSQNKDT